LYLEAGSPGKKMVALQKMQLRDVGSSSDSIESAFGDIVVFEMF
jgi:hypothetical protein